MAKNMKTRMIAVGGIIVIVLILAVAIIGGSSSAKVVSVDEAAAGNLGDAKLQVSGIVVDNSYEVDTDGVLTFDVCDENGGTSTLHVSFDKGVSATFGNGITAICTGRMDGNGTLVCSELITKCPSKYENATDALGVSQILGYGDTMIGKTAKITGLVAEGTLADATNDIRLVLVDADDATVTVNVRFAGALSDEIADGSSLVVMGALADDGTFLATGVALEG